MPLCPSLFQGYRRVSKRASSHEKGGRKPFQSVYFRIVGERGENIKKELSEYPLELVVGSDSRRLENREWRSDFSESRLSPHEERRLPDSLTSFILNQSPSLFTHRRYILTRQLHFYITSCLGNYFKFTRAKIFARL